MRPTWGPSGADKTQGAPCGPHELSYLGLIWFIYWSIRIAIDNSLFVPSWQVINLSKPLPAQVFPAKYICIFELRCTSLLFHKTASIPNYTSNGQVLDQECRRCQTFNLQTEGLYWAFNLKSSKFSITRKYKPLHWLWSFLKPTCKLAKVKNAI